MFFVKRWAFGMALVQQLGHDRWSVVYQHAAIWHWYLSLCVYVLFVSIPFVCLQLKKLVSIIHTKVHDTYQHVLALCAHFFIFIS